MAITFNEVPNNLRAPGIYIEIDNSKANTAEDLQETLIITEMSGTATADTLYPAPTDKAISDIFGVDSVAHKMVKMVLLQNQAIPLSVLAVDASGTVDISGALAALGDEQYHYIAMSFNDSGSVSKLETFLDERYNALNQNSGIGFITKKDNHANLITFGDGYNSRHLSILPINSVDVSDAEFLAAWVGLEATARANDPLIPTVGRTIKGVKSTASVEWTLNERNLLLHDGISTYTSNKAKQVMIDRTITTYQENSLGSADDSYLDIGTVLAAMLIRAKQKARLFRDFANYKLASDSANFGPGQPVARPKDIKSSLIALYKEMENMGLVQEAEYYINSLKVEIDASNPNRINYLDQPVLMNGLMIFAGRNQFLRKV